VLSRRDLLLTPAAAVAASSSAAGAPQPPIHVGSRRELFVDRELVDTLEGDAQLRLASPVPRETVLHLDRPYEGPFSAYFTMLLCEDKRYRVFYRGVPDAGPDGRANEVTCYAESEDGVRFHKPADNIVLSGQPPYSHNFCPFLDRNPATRLGRYKAIAGTASSGLKGWTSDDALHWRPVREQPVLPAAKLPMYDSQNVAFWSEAEGCYVAYARQFRDGIRSIARATSGDFLAWTPFVPLEIEGPPTHLYTSQMHPYYRAPHIYAGIAARFVPGRQALTDDEAKQAGILAGYYKDASDSVLLTSRAGSARIAREFGDAFLRPGPGISNWSSRGNYPALNVVPTGEEEMSFYVNRHYGQATSHLQRLTLRADGFASLNAGWRGGVFTSKPLLFSGSRLELNFAASAAGSMRVAIPEAGLTFETCQELAGDRLARQVRWTGANPEALAALSGKPVRLKIWLRDADLYSFQFLN
jgi:hypothetical protein